MSIATCTRVISMSDGKVRRDAFSQQVDTTLDWSFFDALREPGPATRYDPELAATCFGRRLSPGEVGCYASHVAVWAEFLRGDCEQLIVLEDDVVVDWAVLERLAATDLAALDIHILRLYATHPPRFDLVAHKLLSDHTHLLRLKGYIYGTQAYLLTRRGAEKLAAHCRQLCMPIDWNMSRYWSYGVPNHCIFPFPAYERLTSSTIGDDRAAAPTLGRVRRLRSQLWRGRERLSREFYELRHVGQRLRQIRDDGPALL